MYQSEVVDLGVYLLFTDLVVVNYAAKNRAVYGHIHLVHIVAKQVFLIGQVLIAPP